MRQLVSIVIMILGSACLPGQAAPPDVWASLMGSPPPLLVATAATGPWATKHPFDATTFGKTRGFSPSTEVEGSCILVYLRKLDANQQKLVSKLNAITQANPKMEPCFIHLFDVKGAQRGGYTADELQTRINELKVVADKHQWKHSSLGITANARGFDQVGLDDQHDTAIVLIRPMPGKKSPVTTWYRLTSDTLLTEAGIQELETSLRGAIK